MAPLRENCIKQDTANKDHVLGRKTGLSKDLKRADSRHRKHRKRVSWNDPEWKAVS